MKRSSAILTALCGAAFLAAGCTEIDQKAKTEKVYAGKKDERPYGDKDKWEVALKERSKGQNEYLRTETK